MTPDQLLKRKFLPCPHCGSEDLDGPHLREYIGDHYDPSWWIECECCPCGMTTFGEEVTTLLDAWNRRANQNG